MTAKSSDEEAKSKRTIKATTGAWWNTKVDVASDAQEKKEKKAVSKDVPAKEVKEKKVEKPAAEKPKRPRKPRKKAQESVVEKEATPKAASTEKNAKPPAPVEKAPEEPSVQAPKAEDKPQPRKRQGRRTPRKPSVQNEKVQESSPQQSVKEESVQTTSSSAEESQEASTGNQTQNQNQNQKRRPRPQRKPRGRRPQKPKVEETTAPEQAPAVASGETPEAPSPAVEAETSKTEEAAKRPPRKRSRRSRKKRVEKPEQDSAQAETVAEGEAVATADDVTQTSAKKESKWKNVPEQPAEPKNVRLLINAEEPEECRLALLEDGRLQSLHVTTVARTQTKSNIYKAKIVAIEPNLQAAFVDYGTPKNGFLPFSEIHPEYYKTDLSDEARDNVENRRWKRLKIENVMERGQELLVQVVKEEVGKKGANMTTYLSLPGRCVVLMPGSDSAGISRKISGEEKRSHLRDIMRSIEIPEGIGWIVRTASIDITEAALQRDVTFLLKLWEDIREKGQSIENVGLAYEDHRSVLRFLREHFDPSIQEILVDAPAALEQVNEFVSMLPTAQQNVKVRLHKGSRPIFNQFSVEDQIESIYQPQVNLPSGGSIVIDPTEALVAIDVNSGSTSKGKNFEESIYQANMEAAAELARQLRLRDLGGLVVVDFIDMRNKKHIRDVERQVKDAMKRDKAKVDFSRISKFGLMQISRQKLGSPLEAGTYRVCKHCKGRGTVRAVETLALFYLRRIQTGASRNPVVKVECRFPLDVASYLLNNKRQELNDLEEKYNVAIVIIADTNFRPAENEIVFHRQEKDKNDEK